MAAYDFGVWSVVDEERALPLQRSLAAHWQAGLETVHFLWIGLKKKNAHFRTKQDVQTYKFATVGAHTTLQKFH